MGLAGLTWAPGISCWQDPSLLHEVSQSAAGQLVLMVLGSLESVTQQKSVCLMHSEPNNTETLEFGAEKGLLQGQVGRTGASCPPKAPDSLKCLTKHF